MSADAGSTPLPPQPWRRRAGRLQRLATRPLGPSRQLSIEATFTLITLINASVLLYLLGAAIGSLRLSGSGDGPVVVTLSLTVLLAVLAALSYLILRQRIVGPIRRLLREARLIHGDEPDRFFSTAGEDEISLLAAGFNAVLTRMRQALRDLDGSNQQLRSARQQIESSLSYANVLQRSVLPDRELQEIFGSDHCLLWLPRDSVGGDCYMAHRSGPLALMGVGDCAGHGVSGAMMAMLARAAFDRAIQDEGLHSPAALLQRTDAVLRTLLGEADSSRAVATTMDLGLVLLDLERQCLRFAGARIALHWSDGERLGCQRGVQRSLGESRVARVEDHPIPLDPAFTYTLSTDGLLDQAGGASGFCLGRERFEQWRVSLPPCLHRSSASL
ncbi:MAG: SpoIIE family protein phosphatase [Cyanobium sp.]